MPHGFTPSCDHTKEELSGPQLRSHCRQGWRGGPPRRLHQRAGSGEAGAKKSNKQRCEGADWAVWFRFELSVLCCVWEPPDAQLSPLRPHFISFLCTHFASELDSPAPPVFLTFLPDHVFLFSSDLQSVYSLTCLSFRDPFAWFLFLPLCTPFLIIHLFMTATSLGITKFYQSFQSKVWLLNISVHLIQKCDRVLIKSSPKFEAAVEEIVVIPHFQRISIISHHYFPNSRVPLPTFCPPHKAGGEGNV